MKDINGKEYKEGDLILLGQVGSRHRIETNGIPQIVKITKQGVFAGDYEILDMYSYCNEIIGNVKYSDLLKTLKSFRSA